MEEVTKRMDDRLNLYAKLRKRFDRNQHPLTEKEKEDFETLLNVIRTNADGDPNHPLAKPGPAVL